MGGWSIWEKARIFWSIARRHFRDFGSVSRAWQGPFGKHLGFDGALEAAKIVRELLMPLTTRKLEANNRDLPLYAEAAPRAFLNIIEQDLQSDNSEVLGLLRPVGTWIFSTCPRTGLLWALEALAWNPSHLSKSSEHFGTALRGRD